MICAYAARVLAEGRHPRRLPAAARSEGWILVDDGRPAPEPPRRVDPGYLVSLAAETRVRDLFDSFDAALEASAEPLKSDGTTG